MTGYGARRGVPRDLAGAGKLIRRALAALFPVRPERKPGALPLPRREVIRPHPERYGYVARKKLPASDGRPPWETAVLPALTDAVLAAIESGAYGTRRGGAS